MTEMTGLKNRGYSKADVGDRKNAVEKTTKANLKAIEDYSFDPECASKNIENMIGVVQIPLGFAGPVKIDGDCAKGEFLVPMATTEGALVASVSRGMSVISASGGAKVKIYSDAMTRAPVFRTEGIEHTDKVISWITKNIELLDKEVCKTTEHGKLMEIEVFPNGRNLHLRLAFTTGDAMGMNMATIASEAVGRLIEKETGAVMISVSGNMCCDKKSSMINTLRGRGKTIVAEARIPSDVVEEKLHTSVESIIEVNTRKNLIGSAMAGSLGQNAHAANMLAAVFIATGQDPAQVAEGSETMTTCESYDDGLYIAVRIPALEVGTVGGGTRLPTQSAALEMIGCKGEGKSKKLAEIIAATVLAGELSTLGAQAAGQLGAAHKKLGR